MKGAGVKRVKFVVVDLLGNPKGVVVDIYSAKDVLESGFGFDGSSVPRFAPVYGSDVNAEPDLSAVYIEEWSKSAWVFCDVTDPPSAAELDTRLFLKRVEERVRKKGLEAKIGIEVVFFLVTNTDNGFKPADSGGILRRRQFFYNAQCR